DVITIAGVYPANPQSRTQYGNQLKQFVVLPPGGYTQNPAGTATPGLSFATASLTNGTFNAATGQYTSKSDGTLSLTIGECVITGGQFQNCVVPAGTISSSAALTVWGSVNGAYNNVT